MARDRPGEVCPGLGAAGAARVCDLSTDAGETRAVVNRMPDVAARMAHLEAVRGGAGSPAGSPEQSVRSAAAPPPQGEPRHGDDTGVAPAVAGMQGRRSTVRLGFCTGGLSLPWAEKLALALRLNLAGVQVGPAEFGGGADPASAKRARETAKAHGLEITATTAGPNLVDPEGLEERIQRFRTFFRLSLALGSGLVTGEVKAKPPRLTEAAAWETVLYAVGAVVRIAEEEGGVFALEAGPGCLVRTAAQVERVLTAVAHPRLKVNFDARNYYVAGDDPVEVVVRLGREIVHGHINDGVRTGPDGAWAPRPVGSGEVDHPAILRALERQGFDGCLCVEHCRSVAELEASLDYLRRNYSFGSS